MTSVDSRKNVIYRTYSTSENQNSVGKDVNVTAEMTWDIKSAPKLDFDEDYYSVLEVDSKIVPKDLKKAYYSIVFIYHPDRKSEAVDKELANKQMMVINGKFSAHVISLILFYCDDASCITQNTEHSLFNIQMTLQLTPLARIPYDFSLKALPINFCVTKAPTEC